MRKQNCDCLQKEELLVATIRDVAELANVSIASVSRILNQDPDYKATPETREKVLKAISSLDYKPNPNYKKRRAATQVSIGCISRMTVERTKDSYYTTIFNGAQNYLKRQNYDFDFVVSQFDIMNEESLSSLLSHPPKGLILMDQPDNETMRYLSSKIKYIVGIDSGQSSVDNICYDRFDAGCRAMQYLIDKGHKKIAYIGAHISENVMTIGRYEAYVRMMRQAKLPVNPAWVIDSDWHRGICFDKTIELMRCADRPTALFVGSDHMAIAAISALHKLNISIPDEISVIGISDIEDAKYLNPPLTTIAIPQVEIGEIAASTLLQRIGGDLSLPKRIVVPTALVERSSVAPPKIAE
ncbi:MAG: LacI family transcriptional regulator [Clostridia bacterium]|nr:LacI family transcriptional regulator [Clostridia bacterium]